MKQVYNIVLLDVANISGIVEEHTSAAPMIWYVQTSIVVLHTFYMMLLFILILCYFNIISELLQYCICI
jgi:hypothetical protein